MNPNGAWVSLRPLALAVACDCSFVARGFAGDGEHLAMLIQMAIKHKGFALVEVLQPCPTFNRRNTFQWYSQRVYKLDEAKDYDPKDRTAAFNKALEWGDRIPIGLIYRNDRPIFEDYIGVTGKVPLVREKIDRFNSSPSWMSSSDLRQRECAPWCRCKEDSCSGIKAVRDAPDDADAPLLGITYTAHSLPHPWPSVLRTAARRPKGPRL